MKLNYDLVRNILLTIEEQQDSVYDKLYNRDFSELIDEPGISSEQLEYTIKKLNEAGYTECQAFRGNEFIVDGLTWNGHQFLDNIRDDGIWKNTKSIASKFSSVSASFLSQIAVGVLTEIINRQLGN